MKTTRFYPKSNLIQCLLPEAAERQIGEQIGSDVRHVETDATTPTTTRIRQLLVAAGEQLQSTFADLTVA